MLRPLSTEEGHFIAGFIEGESHLAIAEANGGQSFRCLMQLSVRDDDVELIEWLCSRTGLGRVLPIAAQGNSRPQVQWRIETQRECRALVALLDRFEMRGRKRREFQIWRVAVELWTSGLSNRAVLARRLRDRLRDARRFRTPADLPRAVTPASPEAMRGYLHGFLCAEGSFTVASSNSGVCVHLRQDDRPLLEMLCGELGVGYVRDQRAYPPGNPSVLWSVARLDDVGRLAAWLDPAQLRGRKAAELEIWLQAVAERQRARAAGRRPELDGLIQKFKEARAYRPGRPPVTTSRVVSARAHSLDILRRWAAKERGPLSCGRYAAAREPGWPTRNTVARLFGSWAAALEAAGLTRREASTAEVREARLRGGSVGRAAARDAQRERVLATLRYGIVLHGSIPTATQFFRWRLVDVPATPSQATIYRLFPGGWKAVLEALAEQDPDIMRPPVIRPVGEVAGTA